MTIELDVTTEMRYVRSNRLREILFFQRRKPNNRRVPSGAWRQERTGEFGPVRLLSGTSLFRERLCSFRCIATVQSRLALPHWTELHSTARYFVTFPVKVHGKYCP